MSSANVTRELRRKYVPARCWYCNYCRQINSRTNIPVGLKTSECAVFIWSQSTVSILF